MQGWPIYYKDRLYIANLNSNIGIITLWSPIHTILPKLNQDQFAIGGQLYSKRGINFVIRNILAYPRIDTIIICGSNLSGSAESLINFLENGVDGENNVIGVEKSPIDKEIDRELLELFRSRVRLVKLVNEFRPETIQAELNKFSKADQGLWSEPKTFAEPEKVTAEKFPSEKSHFTIRSGTIKDAWVQIIRHIMKFGSTKGAIKVGNIKELLNITTIIEDEDPNNPDIPDWFNFDNADLKLYYKGFFSKEADSEDYNYGQRIFSHPLGIPNEEYKSPNNTKTADSFITVIKNQVCNSGVASLCKTTLDSSFRWNDKNSLFEGITLNQLEEVYLKLKNYKYDRGAILSIWNPWVDNISRGWQSDPSTSSGQVKSGNVPCMTQLQFAYREHKLHLTAYFRANDMFDAWPRNAFALRKLQFDLAKKLDMKPGHLITISSIAQIYESNFDEAGKIMERFHEKAFCHYEQRGNFIIELEGDEIIARHTDTSGNEIMEEFRINGKEPRAAIRLGDILIANLGISEIAHALDLGRELQKAEIAVKNGLKYRQDKDLEL